MIGLQPIAFLLGYACKIREQEDEPGGNLKWITQARTARRKTAMNNLLTVGGSLQVITHDLRLIWRPYGDSNPRF